ncbi:MAG: hypothetical protein DRJ46_04035 [Thermoprotei archaeon]|nr:MAG: hypothetical protein DRJ46_04035 [Thermoprotei archaeon]HDJ97531.1 isopentenyl phosphate kinase family protein [Thermofilum sp.]
MNKRPLAVVKLGGSLITDKTNPFTLRKHVLRQIAEELATAYEDTSLLVVHGGGSFGHPVAAKYAIKEGHDGSKRKLEGFSQTRYWMTVLNLKVVKELAQRGLPAVPFQTSAFTYTVNKELREYWIKPLAKALKLGLVPVVYGDAVLDDKLGFTILSGDLLAAQLAIELNANTLVYAVDVEGIMDKDPRHSPDAKLIKELSINEALKIAGNASGVDVTGGMAYKIRCAAKALAAKIRVVIGSGTIPGNILAMIKGKSGTYTTLKI